MEAWKPGASVTAVAERHGLARSQVYKLVSAGTRRANAGPVDSAGSQDRILARFALRTGIGLVLGAGWLVLKSDGELPDWAHRRIRWLTVTVFGVLFVAFTATFDYMFWPYMIPYSLTVASAAAPDASLRFLFYGGVVVLPVIAAYTIGVYWVFRGKIGKVAGNP